jgi:GNAT superfamily N-acetyltransferase
MKRLKAFAAPATGVTIHEVTSAADREAFVQMQFSLYRGDESFVPPIVAERRDFLNPERNPFFHEARCALFIAKRGSTVVGRVAATLDHRYNRFHHTSDGFMGLFESENELGIASSLLSMAADWAKRQGARRLVGPVNLAFHHDVGLLVEGFERPPSMMMPYNPRYYPKLFESNGFTKLKDLYSYELATAAGLPEKVVRFAQRARRNPSITLRRLNVSQPDKDVAQIKAILETMMKPGLGFAPLSDAEFMAAVNRMKPIIQLRPELSLIAEVDGVPVAFSITMPDAYVALKAANGYLFPFGLAKLLWAARGIKRVRVLLFGIQDGFRRRGIDALLALETHERALALGYTAGEMGWVLEDDTPVIRTIEATGAKKIKTYRLYQRPLGS